MVKSYVEQIGGVLDGGADMLMIETTFDTQNARAAIFAVDDTTGRPRRNVFLL